MSAPKSAFELQQSLLGQLAPAPRVDAHANWLVQFFQSHRIELVAAVACLGLMALVFELVRRHEIKEKYSFLWFLTGASLLVLSLKREWLNHLAAALGVYYPPTALFLVLGFFMIVILVHYSMVLSRLLAQNQKLAQKIALLKTEVEALVAEKPARGKGSNAA